MCGILGIVAKTPVNQLLYDGLLLLQHRECRTSALFLSTHRYFRRCARRAGI